ncbi:Clan CA, family C19, ubiquitin hydrolase-like cysteine peptidase [Tritrichomonas foetus]|uniref:ubiquitinyl hydrolase 1 n=1 Tax=Tritrichomonas foetus TaxID=1144522 RepID=A0A1J4KEY0_9EUKA|nr:Clan CA, family C19, ubiquitin hydrolase-like cysteine peptidase [Tritrichomonas foetus]|eukprot:OHT08150.1 Clan CA, family C19, ubiquitin hydrolase-like cysteine peptidase [Tritrichomonas foetus]
MFFNLPSPEEQKQRYKQLEQESKLIPGENAYLISMKWLSTFKRDIGYYYHSENERQCGKIDNSRLLNSSGEFDSEKVNERIDYEIVTKDVWNQLFEWYGGGPEIKAPIVQSVTGPKVVLQFLNLQCFYKNESINIKCHKFLKGGELKAMIIHEFGLPENTEARLIDYWHKQIHNTIIDEKEIHHFSLYEGQEVLLDTKNEDGQWESEAVSQKEQTFNYSASSPSNNNYYYNNNNNNNIYNTSFNINDPFGQNSRSNSIFHNHSPSPNYSTTPSYSSSYYGDGYSSQPAEAPGVVGLRNLGNTCFFNSGTQCLLHSNPLCHVFLNTNWEADLNTTNPIGMKGRLASAFADLMRRVWSGNENCISPNDLKMVIGEFAPQFSGFGQQDSHELITFMLDGIHEDLNRVIHKPIVEGIDGDGTNDLEISEKSWEIFKSRNDSVIVDNFYGQYRSVLLCPNCHSTTVVFDPFVTLTLPITKPKNRSLTVTFVPREFNQKYQTINIDVKPSSSFATISKIVSEKIGKNVNVVFGTKRYGFEIGWGVEEYEYAHKPKYLAFEIDNIDESKFYVVCLIKAEKSEQISSYSSLPTDYEVPGLFLVELDHDNPSEEEIAEAAENKLSCLWNEYTGDELPENAIALKNQIKFKEVRTSRRIAAEIPSFCSYTKPSIGADKEFHYLGSKVAIIRINPAYANETHAFSMDTLLSHVKPKVSKNYSGGFHFNSVNLDDCFSYFSAPDKLDEDNKWFCPKCRDFVCADKKMDIWKVPRCLIIHLKRFTGSSLSATKDNTNVDYPSELDLSNFIVGPQKNEPNLKYKLYAVSEHMGGLSGGHYTAHAIVVNEHSHHGKWYSFNDSSTFQSSEEQAKNGSAYVLFYQRCE